MLWISAPSAHRLELSRLAHGDHAVLERPMPCGGSRRGLDRAHLGRGARRAWRAAARPRPSPGELLLQVELGRQRLRDAPGRDHPAPGGSARRERGHGGAHAGEVGLQFLDAREDVVLDGHVAAGRAARCRAGPPSPRLSIAGGTAEDVGTGSRDRSSPGEPGGIPQRAPSCGRRGPTPVRLHGQHLPLADRRGRHARACCASRASRTSSRSTARAPATGTSARRPTRARPPRRARAASTLEGAAAPVAPRTSTTTT